MRSCLVTLIFILYLLCHFFYQPLQLFVCHAIKIKFYLLGCLLWNNILHQLFNYL